MSNNTFIQNPYSKDNDFGFIPHMEKYPEFQEGFIKLRVGKHRGPNRGFGVNHIWAEHKQYLIKKGYQDWGSVADILQPGSPIYCEFNNIRGNHRVAVVKSTLGQAILEKKQDANNKIFYSVVTAFEGKNAHGTRIGTVR
ncbi:hypothetical protein QUF61_03880 [Candidatus Venteria ishoeyi]|uniref:hypothetical protein n=1 Tax=Candidatus Venteria ishoeyi TaxID=1899563 RepID=UPI0025A584BF|nr:hypothetical protein [Candidatus Venteria ishoeyi]MDM8545614.1 hypothetical protein [Candidatus Venteria ishoeyi]